jgi:NADH:ubiquinone oxidoreductase subunit 6 (subunit J)
MLAAIDWYAMFFWLFALLSAGFALAVLFSHDIVRMAFYLILSLGAVSGLFFLAGADLIGVMQLMIYVGGTLVLLVFGVMLTARGRFVRMKTSGGEWVLTLFVAGALLLLLVRSAFMVESWRNPLSADARSPATATSDHPRTPNTEHRASAASPAASPTTAPIGLALSGVRVDGGTGRSGYMLPFVIVSVHLLVVLVGAAYLARPRRRVGAEEDERRLL